MYVPSPSSCRLCGWETVKHCMISYCCLASGFSESTSSGGLLSIRQLNVWLFLRPGSCGHGTPFTARKQTNNTTCCEAIRPIQIGGLNFLSGNAKLWNFPYGFHFVPVCSEAERVGSSTSPGYQNILNQKPHFSVQDPSLLHI